MDMTELVVSQKDGYDQEGSAYSVGILVWSSLSLSISLDILEAFSLWWRLGQTGYGWKWRIGTGVAVRFIPHPCFYNGTRSRSQPRDYILGYYSSRHFVTLQILCSFFKFLLQSWIDLSRSRVVLLLLLLLVVLYIKGAWLPLLTVYLH